jgi:hypothetical protein
VAGYTITITSNDETAAQTTIRVDTASGSARITELTVRAAEGGGIFPQQLPALNLDQLIAALVPPAPTAIASSDESPTASAESAAASAESAPASAELVPTEPASSESAAVEQASAQADVPESAPSPEASDEPVETPQPASVSARGGRSSRAKKAARTAPAKTAPARSRQTKAERTAATQSPNGRRAYRRMPEANELLSAYREVGGTTALARHYGVPRHTATGWLRRLRMQGLLES